MSWTEIEIDESGKVTVRRGGTLTGDTGTRSGDTLQPLLDRLAETGEIEAEPEPMAEPEPEPMKGAPVTRPAYTESTVEPKPKLVTWRKCVRIAPNEINDAGLIAGWHPSGNIPVHWYPLESQSQPVETVKQLPEGEEP